MEITDKGGYSGLRGYLLDFVQCHTPKTYPMFTGTVGEEKVVLIEYIGMGLKGFVVSQLTSTTTANLRVLPAAMIVSGVRNDGI